MQINVAQQLKGAIGSIRSYELSEIVDIGNGGRLVQGKVSLMRTNRGILVKGTFRTEIEVTCSRCLSSFDYPLTLNIEEEYFPTTDVINGTALSVPDEPGCFTIDEHHVLDLTDAISQYALLAVPMKPLCREDCAGLCPGCGHDLNREPCGCSPQKVELHWSELKNRSSIPSLLAPSARGRVKKGS